MIAFTKPSWLARGAGVLLLATVLAPPWEYYSCCHAGFSLEPYAVGSAGYWLVGFAPEPRNGFPVRLAAAEYSWCVAGAGLLLAVALLAGRGRSLPPPRARFLSVESRRRDNHGG